MKEIIEDCQVYSENTASISRNATSVAAVQIQQEEDWESLARELCQQAEEAAAELLKAVRNHFLKLGEASHKLASIVAERGKERAATKLFRHRLPATLRKDIEVSRRLYSWIQTMGLESEQNLDFILSGGVGLKAGIGLLEKIPDSLTKTIGVPEERKVGVAQKILADLVDIQIELEQGESKAKGGVKPADVTRAIARESVPEQERVSFKESSVTYRGKITDYSEETDAVKIRIDNSGEEREIVRGSLRLDGKRPPRLHDFASIRGDESELYGQRGILKKKLPDSKALVLLLDGREVEVPFGTLEKEPGSPIGELLELVDASEATAKVDLAVERASRNLRQEIDSLRVDVDRAYNDGRISAAVELRQGVGSIAEGAERTVPEPTEESANAVGVRDCVEPVKEESTIEEPLAESVTESIAGEAEAVSIAGTIAGEAEEISIAEPLAESVAIDANPYSPPSVSLEEQLQAALAHESAAKDDYEKAFGKCAGLSNAKRDIRCQRESAEYRYARSKVTALRFAIYREKLLALPQQLGDEGMRLTALALEAAYQK